MDKKDQSIPELKAVINEKDKELEELKEQMAKLQASASAQKVVIS